jgi:hypothetical protein
LLPEDGEVVLTHNWAEPHPIDGYRPGIRYLMIFAPRNAEELEVIEVITRRAYDWTLA